ncbi:MAG: acetyl-CoA C-acyltransferase FadI [Myxococcota bacterium]
MSFVDGPPSGPNGKAVIVGGLRTPFVKSGTEFRHLSALDLAKGCVVEMLDRLSVSPEDVDRVVFGQVVPSTRAPNIAREIVLGTSMHRAVDAYSVSRACATGTQAIVDAAMAVLLGDADVVVAGGAESLSRPPITVSDSLTDALMEANAAKDPLGKAKAFLDLKPKDLLPSPPAIAEMATGETMGESAEKMAKANRISRSEQDRLAYESHRKSAAAWEAGIYRSEVMPLNVGPEFDATVEKDGLVRPDTSPEKLAKLKPVFDRKYGSVTAGNASPLTDGAAAVLVMSEKRAAELGLEVQASIRSWAFAALDPSWQLLMGPAFASPKALKRAGLAVSDMDLVDMHEAFAAQVGSNLDAFASSDWASKHLGWDSAIGAIDEERLNVYGGSISLGHPFAATGARQALTMANELRRRGSGTALITQCAAGGLGAALILER